MPKLAAKNDAHAVHRMAAVALCYDRCVNSAQLNFPTPFAESIADAKQSVNMRIQLRIVPNAKMFRVEPTTDGFKVYVKEKAEGNKANIALLKGLKRLLKREVRLVLGARARNKVLEVEGTEKEVLGALRAASAKKGA